MNVYEDDVKINHDHLQSEGCQWFCTVVGYHVVFLDWKYDEATTSMQQQDLTWNHPLIGYCFYLQPLR